jgi:hypothetical protein
MSGNPQNFDGERRATPARAVRLDACSEGKEEAARFAIVRQMQVERRLPLNEILDYCDLRELLAMPAKNLRIVSANVRKSERVL